MDWDPERTLQVLEQAFLRIESHIDKPTQRPYRGEIVFRYAEEGVKQAVVQKLARMITGLRAALVLLEAGFFQEVGVLQRVLGDLDEEVQFLCYALFRDEMTDLHERFLKGFYTEVFVDTEAEVPSVQTKIPKVNRKNIREYLEEAGAELAGSPEDPSRLKSLGHQISTMYSGFVHGSSSHIMTMFGGPEMVYQLHGMRRTPLYEGHRNDLWNQFYRSILAFHFAAVSFGDEELQSVLLEFKRESEKSAGVDNGTDEDDV